MTIPIKVKPWEVPAYVELSVPGHLGEQRCCIPVEHCEPEALAAMCDAFRAAVFAKANKKDPAQP